MHNLKNDQLHLQPEKNEVDEILIQLESAISSGDTKKVDDVIYGEWTSVDRCGIPGLRNKDGECSAHIAIRTLFNRPDLLKDMLVSLMAEHRLYEGLTPDWKKLQDIQNNSGETTWDVIANKSMSLQLLDANALQSAECDAEEQLNNQLSSNAITHTHLKEKRIAQRQGMAISAFIAPIPVQVFSSSKKTIEAFSL